MTYYEIKGPIAAPLEKRGSLAYPLGWRPLTQEARDHAALALDVHRAGLPGHPGAYCRVSSMRLSPLVPNLAAGPCWRAGTIAPIVL